MIIDLVILSRIPESQRVNRSLFVRKEELLSSVKVTWSSCQCHQPASRKMHRVVALRMLGILLFLICAVESTPFKRRSEQTTEVVSSRQSAPINAALTGLFSPPFIIMVGMSALFYTFEKFAKDMMKAASETGRNRFRKKKKKPAEAAAAAPPPAPVATFKREHRKFIRSLKEDRQFVF